MTEQNNECNARGSGQRWYAEEKFLCQVPLSPCQRQS